MKPWLVLELARFQIDHQHPAPERRPKDKGGNPAESLSLFSNPHLALIGYRFNDSEYLRASMRSNCGGPVFNRTASTASWSISHPVVDRRRNIGDRPRFGSPRQRMRQDPNARKVGFSVSCPTGGPAGAIFPPLLLQSNRCESAVPKSRWSQLMRPNRRNPQRRSHPCSEHGLAEHDVGRMSGVCRRTLVDY
jgi:hypothetical protein